MNTTGILLISCEDAKGILASVCEFILQHNGNIISLQEHVEKQENRFFARVEWEMNEFLLQKRKEFDEAFQQNVGDRYKMVYSFHHSNRKPKVCVFVSQYSHCIEDLLYRYKNGELAIDIPLIISNHNTLQSLAQYYQIPYYFIPIQKQTKAQQEKKQLELLRKYQIDLIVLARYMQILSPSFVNQYVNQIINIHHSFLPAFTGAKPYHAAHKRGVKLIGATAHFVTEELDEGPIICQATTQITHRDTVQDMIVKGRDAEKITLSKAVKLFVERKVIAFSHRTVVFS